MIILVVVFLKKDTPNVWHLWHVQLKICSEWLMGNWSLMRLFCNLRITWWKVIPMFQCQICRLTCKTVIRRYWCNGCHPSHEDVIKFKHFPRYWPFARGIHRGPVNSPHKGQWCGALPFSLIRVWINGFVNNREAGDSRRYRVHYDITVMWTNGHSIFYWTPWNVAECTHL